MTLLVLFFSLSQLSRAGKMQHFLLGHDFLTLWSLVHLSHSNSITPGGFVCHLWWQAAILSWHWSAPHLLHLAQTSWCHCGTPVSWTARGRQRSQKTQTTLHRNRAFYYLIMSLHATFPSFLSLYLFLTFSPHCYPSSLILTRLHSSVLVRSLSSVMKIMLLLFFFFLLFLILTSASPTVIMLPSSPILTLPLERGRVAELQEIGDSGGLSLGGGRKV